MPLVTAGEVGRQQIEVYQQVDKPFHYFGFAFREVVSLAFACLVERHLEGIHARINIHAKQANSVRRLPSTVNAGLRWPEVEALLKTDKFHSFAIRHWGRLEWKDIFCGLFSKVELSRMTKPSKIEALYMYDVESQFAADKHMQDDMRAWAQAVASGNIPGAIPLTESESAATDFFKHILEPGHLPYLIEAAGRVCFG